MAALAVAASALAEKPRVQLTSEGQASARAVVLKRTDFAGAGWKGGVGKADLSSDLKCAGFDPKQSDLVIVGASRSQWAHSAGVQFGTEAQVMKTERMLELDWQRTVLSPQMMSCLRTTIASEVVAWGRFVSIRRLSFPNVTSRTAAFRVLFDVSGGRLMMDAIVVGAGRTEITLTAIAPVGAAIGESEVRFARLLASRAT
jgi:hypothetical protein